jgi:hypothetical protein
MKRTLRRHADESVRDGRSREWERTAFVAWGAAIAAGIWSRAVKGADTGDVILALYFAALGLGLWIQAVRMRFARKAPSFTPTLATVLASALAIALLLGLADLASNGRF